jgi:hypothetical protein
MADIRIPNLPTGPIADEKGVATDGESTFRRILITSLQKNFGNEGVVVPTQPNDAMSTPPTDYIDKIQNNTVYNPATGANEYTCQFGTILYNSTANSIMIAIDNGAGAPIFKTVTLT